jgi:ElaB/YqjD/DUF883 family membrane-anchored ribosome-binding protein
MSEGSIASAIGYENLVEQLKEQAMSKIGGDKLAKANAVLSQLTQANMLLNHYDFYNKIAKSLNDKAEGVKQAVKEKIGEKLGTSDEETGLMETLTGLKEGAEEKVGQLTKLASNAQAFIKDPQQALTKAVLDNLGVKAEDGTELTEFISNQVTNFKAQAEGFTDFVNASQPIKNAIDGLQNARGDLEDMFNTRQSELLAQQNNLEDRYSSFANDLFDKENRLPTPQELAPFQQEADGLVQEAGRVGEQFLKDDGDLVDRINEAQGRLETLGRNILSGIEGYNPAEGIFANLGNLDKPTMSALFEPETMARFEGLAPYLGQFTDKSFIEKASQLVQSPIREFSTSNVEDVAKSFSENAEKVVGQMKGQAEETFNAVRSGVVQASENIKAQTQQALEQGTQKFQEGVEAINQQRQNAEQLVKQGASEVEDTINAVKSGETTASEVGQKVASGLSQAGQQLGEKVGGELGETIATTTETVSSAIPVIGEVIDAGLIISQLITGIADIFKSQPHTPIVQATQQYGI